ncbi:MAG: FtsB family cell division protein [Vicinamibacteria bacterium]
MTVTTRRESKDPASSTRGRRLGETTFRRKAFVLAAFLILAATALNALFGDRGVLGLLKAREEHDTLLRQVQDLEAANERLSEEIRALRTDPLVVERLARETLGMAREGEIVLTVRQPRAR